MQKQTSNAEINKSKYEYIPLDKQNYNSVRMCDEIMKEPDAESALDSDEDYE